MPLQSGTSLMARKEKKKRKEIATEPEGRLTNTAYM